MVGTETAVGWREECHSFSLDPTIKEPVQKLDIQRVKTPSAPVCLAEWLAGGLLWEVGDVG